MKKRKEEEARKRKENRQQRVEKRIKETVECRKMDE